MERKLEIKRKMHESVDTALSPLLEWMVDSPEEKELLSPILSVKHAHYIVDNLYETWAEKVQEGMAENAVYFVSISSGGDVHPAYVIGTLMALLLAKPKKIWLECFMSDEDWEDSWMGDPVKDRIVMKLLRRFPEIQLMKYQTERWSREVNEFINEHREINHLVKIGGQRGIDWQMRFLRKDITVHMPAAHFVWVNFSSVGKLLKDKDLRKFGKYCFEEVFDYECMYDISMRNMNEEEAYVGMTYEALPWSELQTWFVDRIREEKRIVGKIPLYIFGDVAPEEEKLQKVAKVLRVVAKEEFSFNQIFYNFMDLFAC